MVKTSQLIMEYCTSVHTVFSSISFDVYISDTHVYIATTNMKSNVKKIIPYKEKDTKTKTQKGSILEELVSYYVYMYYQYEYTGQPVPIDILSKLSGLHYNTMYDTVESIILRISDIFIGMMDIDTPHLKTKKKRYTMIDNLLKLYAQGIDQ